MSDQLKQVGRIALLVALVAAIGGPDTSAQVGQAEEQKGSITEEIASKGVADWTNGVVRATGVGFPPDDVTNVLRAKAMAKRAAQSVALRNLLEVLQGVRVDSKTTVKNYMVSNDEIQVRVSGMIDRAKMIKEQELPDGSFEVTVEMNLRGELSEIIVPKPTSNPVKLVSTTPSTPTKSRTYTGLVVDARGLGAQPCLAPTIFTEDGEVAYSIAHVEKPQLADNGIVVYMADMPSAQQHPRVTNEPLVVKAVGTGKDNKADLIISNADAQTIHGDTDHYRFLQKAQVLVVLDQTQ